MNPKIKFGSKILIIIQFKTKFGAKSLQKHTLTESLTPISRNHPFKTKIGAEIFIIYNTHTRIARARACARMHANYILNLKILPDSPRKHAKKKSKTKKFRSKT